MEGISTVVHKGKKVYLIDFTNFGRNAEDTVKLIHAMIDEFEKNPLNSVIALINVTNAFFHFETFKAFKEMSEKANPYGKKIAIVGLKGLMKTGFNTINRSNSLTKSFDSEDEAKEWLFSD